MSAVLLEPPLGPMVPLDDDPEQWVARQGMMLRVLVGSGVHGTSIAGTDDEDHMGICVEPPETVIGGRKFEHYEYRTAPVRTGDPGACSGPGDLDLITYSLRKYAHLAAQGNPTILLPFFVPDNAIRFINDFGRELREHRHLFLSARAADRFKGYLYSQRLGLMGLRSGGRNNKGRADIRAEYGYDVKFAGHMVRLGFQGIELLRTGQISLPMRGEELEYTLAVRTGRVSQEDVLAKAAQLEDEIEVCKAMTTLPAAPDYAGIDQWLMSVHRRHWGWM